MEAPRELSFDEILRFMVKHDGKVTNHDLVKHFKKFLTNPETRDEARNTFKRHVNSLATIKNYNNEKWLILKKKYMPVEESSLQTDYCVLSPETSVTEEEAVTPMQTINTEPMSQEPPPYQPPPIIIPSRKSSITSLAGNDELQPKLSSSSIGIPSTVITHNNNRIPINSSIDVCPIEEKEPRFNARRKSSADKENEAFEKKGRMQDISKPVRPVTLHQENVDDIINNKVQLCSESTTTLSEVEQKISVKERKQMFNRMASEGDMLRTHPVNNRKIGHGVDEDDRASVVSLDPKCHEWIVRASQGDYHALAKLCSENPKYAKLKDPSTGYTAMHWASKHGNEDLVKLIGHAARATVNERSNGGYTPLHIAIQFRHENVYRLLVEVYDADPNIRDYYGRQARQYSSGGNAALSSEPYRKFKHKAEKKHSEKDLGFLRIGSLNVRVKKTTEAFSNFLGVGPARVATYNNHHKVPSTRNSALGIPQQYSQSANGREHIHKTWGSADNIQNDNKVMPPPQYTKVKKRVATMGRRSQEYSAGNIQSQSTPTTPNQHRVNIVSSPDNVTNDDSDSDTAFGFDSSWQTK